MIKRTHARVRLRKTFILTTVVFLLVLSMCVRVFVRCHSTLVGFAVYVMVGMIVNKFVRHQEGAAIFPNSEFWGGLPSLVKVCRCSCTRVLSRTPTSQLLSIKPNTTGINGFYSFSVFFEKFSNFIRMALCLLFTSAAEQLPTLTAQWRVNPIRSPNPNSPNEKEIFLLCFRYFFFFRKKRRQTTTNTSSEHDSLCFGVKRTVFGYMHRFFTVLLCSLIVFFPFVSACVFFKRVFCLFVCFGDIHG